jgi:hypothetical protein
MASVDGLHSPHLIRERTQSHPGTGLSHCPGLRSTDYTKVVINGQNIARETVTRGSPDPSCLPRFGSAPGKLRKEHSPIRELGRSVL